jgi:hypothetical protein
LQQIEDFMKRFFAVLGLVLPFVFVSCSGNSERDEISDSDTTSLGIDPKVKANAQNIFNSVADPADITKMISDAGIYYDGALLNNPDKYSSYSTDDYKALNLGVYGTDLSFTSSFEQTQESLLYLKCVNLLCKSLGINGVFDEKTSERIDANKDNRDSLLDIISKSFTQADKFLRENQRGHSSSLLVAGGWIEATYLSIKCAINGKSLTITEEIIEQKSSLKELIALMEGYPAGAETLYVLDELRTLQTPMEELSVKYSSLDKKAEFDPTILSAVDEKISAIRKKITQN